ncbi:zonular occludens toxin domain-containing protein [Paralysiella testudinis]|uniref:Zonular occludens toxin family protein n=1 Tax=Paralysiella testudinis TaxID=2809020 RepID=A0A892ZL54_9NEIS|nr:zonular occludens toxin domain-containing protein [Paralysiella testudinis]QRQ82527.1 zonular occludens toxin family protein [Paralysiella testudinis]
MISLLTGLPGIGKTSFMVWQLMTRKDLKNRPLYVKGITDLQIPHLTIPEGHGIEDMHFWLPKGAILVIDEAQHYFRGRPSGAAVPNYVRWLEEHRHRGVDIFVLTQHPRLIDIHLRSLIGEHRNISKTMLAGLLRQTYWQGCRNPESRADVSDGKNSVFFRKSKAFGLYKSSAQHTKIKGQSSLWVYSLPVLLMATAYGAYYVNARYDAMKQPERAIKPESQSQPQNENQPQQPAPGSYPMASQPQQEQPDNNLKPEEWRPSIDGKPWTAPIYNAHNRNIQTMPYPVGCVQNGNRCTCYTDQGTPIQGMDKGLCIDFVENGIYNPYKQPQQAVAAAVDTSVSAAASSGSVLMLDSKPRPDLMPPDFKSLQ